MPIIPGATVRTGRKSNTPNIGIHFVATSDGGYHVYAIKPSWIPILGHRLRVYIWIGRNSGPLE